MVIKVYDRNKKEKEFTSIEELTTHDKIIFICDRCGREGSVVKSKFTGFLCKRCKLSLLDRSNYKKPDIDYSRISKCRTKESLMQATKTRNANNLKKYGVENVAKLEEIQDKIKKTNLKKYGVRSPFQLESTKDKSRRKKFSDVIERLKTFDVIPLFSFDEYNGASNINNIYKWKCSNCGNEFEDTYYDSKLIPRCLICNPVLVGESKGEKELREFIKNSIKFNDKLEIDCFIEDEKIGFEFNGLYWHSDRFVDKTYHVKKTNYFKEKGISIYHIFEDEWVEKRDIVKSIINNKLNICDKRYFARKCKISKVNSKEAKDFQEENHIQGKSASSVNLGLYYENELVSLMTFSKSRFGNYEWELVRFVNKKNTITIGGASKLLKFFIKNYDPENIVSYSDTRLFNGKMYENLGFVFSHSTPPQYYYVKNGKRFNRMNYQKKYLKNKLPIFDDTLTEKQNMRNNGFNLIYDCGVKVWVLKRKDN